MTLESLNIQATASEIIAVISEFYADETRETGKAARNLDIEEATTKTGESFTVANNQVLWMDEDDEVYVLNGILGTTPREIADDALDAYEGDEEGDGTDWADFYRMTCAW